MNIDSEPAANIVGRYFGRLKRGAYGWDAFFAEANQASSNSLDGIVLEAGILALRAYYTATKAIEKEHGFEGKAELKRVLQVVRKGSIEYQRDFAERLKLLNLQLPGETSADDAIPRPSKRRRTDAIPIESTSPERDLQWVQNTASNITTRNVDVPDRLCVNASLKKCIQRFPPELMDSIQRIPHTHQPDVLVADITMFLQDDENRKRFGCQMEIGISKEKVAFYAKKLFDVEVEANDGERYIRYPGGCIIEPNPHFTLCACKKAVILEQFGCDMNEGFCDAPIFKREEKEARSRTSGLSMSMSNKVTDGAKITLHLSEWYAFNIADELY